MINYGTVRNGALRTDTINTSGIPIDMEARTKKLVPAQYTTRTLVGKFGASVAAKDMTHKFRERRPIPNWTTIAVADAAGQAHIEVADPTYIKNDVVLWVVRAGERIMQLLVQDASIDATVDVVNFTGTTGSGTIPAATQVGDIVVIGNEAHAEGEDVPTAYTNITVDMYDYLMQIDRSVKKTDIESNIDHYDDEEKKLVADLAMAWVEEKQKQNLGMWLGAETREVTSAGGARRYQVKGLIDRLTENVSDYSGVGDGFTLQAIQEDLRVCKDASPMNSEKFLIAGVAANNAISAFPEGSIRVDPRSETWGIAINKIRTQYGDLPVTYDNTLTSKYGLEGRAAILEKAYLRMMHLQGLPLRAFYNITNARDIHNIENCISGTWGVQHCFTETMVMMKGIS